MSSVEVTSFSINMSKDNGDVLRRYYDFGNYCADTRPDIIAVQEVSADYGQLTMGALANRLGADYRMFFDRIYPGEEDKLGVVTITRLPVRGESRITELPSGGNKVQIVEHGDRYNTGSKGKGLVTSNLHLEAMPSHMNLRVHKVEDHAELLKDEFPDYSKILYGDYNSWPSSRCIKRVKSLGFVSTYEAVHGFEPDYTFPSHLTFKELFTGHYVKPHELAILRFEGILRRGGLHSIAGLISRTIDYTFHDKEHSQALSAEIVPGIVNGKPFGDHMGQKNRIKVDF